jgi:hypothetical protein
LDGPERPTLRVVGQLEFSRGMYDPAEKAFT